MGQHAIRVQRAFWPDNNKDWHTCFTCFSWQHHWMSISFCCVRLRCGKWYGCKMMSFRRGTAAFVLCMPSSHVPAVISTLWVLKKTINKKKQYTWLLIITSANVDRFSQFFHWHIPKETMCSGYRVFHFTLICCSTTLQKFKNLQIAVDLLNIPSKLISFTGNLTNNHMTNAIKMINIWSIECR